MSIKGAKVMTLDQFIAKYKIASHTFPLQVLKFQVEVAKDLKRVFRESFFLGRFNSAGEAAWKPRVHRRPHPLLIETSSMANSITYSTPTSMLSGKGRIRIFTDPTKYGNSKRNKNKLCYAGIHNAGGGKMPQRQFIGKTSKLESILNKNNHILFEFL